MRNMHYVGLDVHSRSITVAVADELKVYTVGKIPHHVSRLKKVLAKIASKKKIHVVYEAGPTGYGLCRELRTSGYKCEVIAPGLIPTMPGDRVKTDRRDACKLAMLSRGGLLTKVSVPSLEQEAIRDLVRARAAAKLWQKKAGQQLDKFLLRHDRKPQEQMSKWTVKHMDWVRGQRFSDSIEQTILEEYIAEFTHQVERVKRLDNHLLEAAKSLPDILKTAVDALVALRGVKFLTAVTIVSEIGDMLRFAHPTSLMSYTGVVPREHSSGDRVCRGAITKNGNAHLRRIVGEAAWSYARGISTPSRAIQKRRQGVSPAIVAIAEKADHRLHSRYKRLIAKGKHRNKAITAISRELLGFIWAIGAQAQKESMALANR